MEGAYQAMIACIVINTCTFMLFSCYGPKLIKSAKIEKRRKKSEANEGDVEMLSVTCLILKFICSFFIIFLTIKFLERI